MTGVSVTIDDSEVRRMFSRLQQRVADMSPAMDMIGAQMAGRIKLSFHDGKDPWGNPWRPLSPVTIAKRRKGSSQPLRDTGRLMNSITHRADRDSVTVGTNVEYAGTHQFGAKRGQYGRTKRGGPIPWGDVPARRFMPIDGSGANLPEDWRRDIIGALKQHLEL